MGRNGSHKLDLVSSRGTEPWVEDLQSAARTSRADGLIILFRFDMTLNFSSIDKIGKTEQLCGVRPDSLKLQLGSLGLDDVERNQRSETRSGTGLPHPIPRLLAP